jgi:D-alanyl-D-alanine carboxypeptidase (penicillin-binding protein 5/6)
MASTTKIMTALVALERLEPDTMILVTYGAANTEGSSAGLREGDTMSLKDLLICMMVPSGNDASVAVAENVAGTEFAFVSLMNEKAASLGMMGTHFSNASGLRDEDNYTTPADYLLLTRAAMGNSLFREIVGAPEVSVQINGQTETYHSTNMLLHEMEGANGVKTGFTDEAGYCLIASARKNGFELYAAVFHSSSEEQRFIDAQKLLEWGFAHYRTVELINATKPVASAALLSWIDKTVPVVAASPVAANLFDYAGNIQQEVTIIEKEGSVNKGEKLGSLVWLQNSEVIARIDLLATETVPAPDFWEGIGIWFKRLWGGLWDEAPHATSTTTLPEVFDLEIADVNATLP